jgi:hypothetical protein
VRGGQFEDFGLDGVVDDFFVGHGASLAQDKSCGTCIIAPRGVIR